MRELVFFIVVSSFILAIDFYAFQAIKTIFPLQANAGKIAAAIYWSFTVFIIISIITTLMLGQQNIPRVLKIVSMGIFFFGLLAKIFIIVWLFGEDLYRFLNFAFKKFSSLSKAKWA